MILPPRSPLNGQRHAIVIGANGSNASGLAPLIAPEAHDAPRMAAVLASPACGFHVQPFLGEQALMQPIRDAIETQMKAGTIDDSLIIYFAGHGTITQTPEGPDMVLVTTDTTLDTIMDHPLTCLRVGWLKTVLIENTQTYPIGHVVVILDCCASGMIGQLGHQPLIGDPPAFRRMLVSTYTTHPAYEWNQTSVYTYHLLNALEGQAVDRFGAVTMERVHQYCSEKLAGTGQRCGLDGWDYTGRWQFAWYDLNRPKVVHAAHQSDSNRLLNLRLEGFVGRVAELAAIREHIAAMRPTGGYVLIKAAAGEGKSSTIAKLIQAAGIAQTPHHFIALTPDPKYQLGLLRAVVAQLILKHGLTVSYFPEESYHAMKAEFARILDELSKQGIEETIYLDGLDQLQPENDGSRDLSFLPLQPPPGTVIVLGSRPDETLKPLEILHRVDYDLPPLSEPDALALWRSVQPAVADGLLHDLYTALKGNALFVHLAANTMRDQSMDDAASLIKQIEQNPQNLFGIALDRIKNRSEVRWPTIWRPMVALLVITQEPLLIGVIGRLLRQPRAVIQEAVKIMGGLVSQGNDQRVALHHLLFRDYVQVHEFDAEELRNVHQRLADWCATDVDAIWADDRDPIEQARRVYARHHYITHLALAENWTTLWQVLDAGEYGEHKTRFDPSTRLYALDLDRGRESAIQAGHSVDEHIQNLPRLWKYSLLRTSLTSRVDRWPDEAFEILAMVGRTHEALERIELLSDIQKQISCWLRILPWCDAQQQSLILRLNEVCRHLLDSDKMSVIYTIIKAAATHFQREHALVILDAALTIVQSIDDPRQRDNALGAISKATATHGDIDRALTIAQSIHDTGQRTRTLGAITEATATHEQRKHAVVILDKALTIAQSIDDPWQRAETLDAIAEATATHGDIDCALTIAQSIEDLRKRALTIATIAKTTATQGDINRALTIIQSIHNTRQRGDALDTIAEATATQGDIDRALTIVQSIDDPRQRDNALGVISKATATQGDIDRALTITQSIIDIGQRTRTLGAIARTTATQGDIDRALTIAQSITDPLERRNTLRAIAEATATQGDIDRALTIAQSIHDIGQRTRTLGAIARTTATQGDIDRALTIAQSIHDTEQRTRTLGAISKATATHGDIDHALTIAQSIHDTKRRTWILGAIARTTATRGQREHTLSILNAALTITQSITDPLERRNTLRAIAEATATQGDIDRALTIAQSIHDPLELAKTLGTIAEAASANDQGKHALSILNMALSITQSIHDPRQRIWTVRTLIQATATQGDIDCALTIAQSIHDPLERGDALDAIAEATATQGDIDHALTIAQSIADTEQRTRTLGAIARTTAIHGDIDRALTITQSIHDPSERGDALNTIAKITAIHGAIDHALTIAQSIADIEQRTWTLGAIAEATAIHGDIDHALTIAQSIADTWQCDHALDAIAKITAIHGAIDHALTIAQSIADIEQRTWTLGAIAEATAIHGDIDHALTIAQSIHDPRQRGDALDAIAKANVIHGDINRALTIAQFIPSTGQYTRTLGSIAKATAIRNDIDRALIITQSIVNILHRDDALGSIATAAAAQGNIDHALSIAQSIANPKQRTETLRIMLQKAQSGIDVLTSIQHEWFRCTVANDLWTMTPIIAPLLNDYRWLGTVILEEEAWVNNQLKRLG